MPAPSYDRIVHFLDTLLPISHVLTTTRTFLAGSNWQLEINDVVVSIPADTELVVRTRAFVKAEAQDVFLDDHFEAIVLIGSQMIGQSSQALYGVLRLYFDRHGQFISEDRFDRYH
jgi:hypothetical protein